MKLFPLILVLLVTSCASTPSPRVTVAGLRSTELEPVESVRHGEVLRAYHVGRYVDPNQTGVMHEQHPVYRVEAESRWDLRPGHSVIAQINPLNPPVDAAHVPAPTNDVVLAELSRQKDATERVMWEATQLARSFDQLKKVIADMTTVAKDHTFMGARFGQAERRLGQIEAQLQQIVVPPTAVTNEPPKVLIEEPDPSGP